VFKAEAANQELLTTPLNERKHRHASDDAADTRADVEADDEPASNSCQIAAF
jgi:hypothetical protein